MLGSVLFENDLLRMKACRHGVFLFHRNDTGIGRALDVYGEFAEASLSLLLPMMSEGSVILDVGANIGTTTIAFARRTGPAGKVLAFEPQRQVFHLLCANVALNGLANVQCLNHAAGIRQGRAFLAPVDYACASNFGAVALSPKVSSNAVGVIRLDSLPLQACDVIKIDVEGMEHDVLEGAAGLIEAFSPLLYIEYNPGPGARNALDSLLQRGYRLYWHPTPFVSAELFVAQPVEELRRYDVNILGLPPARSGLMTDLAPIRSVDELPRQCAWSAVQPGVQVR